MNKRVLQGFTLTEIMISLTVIGIIAAITVPGTISKYQRDTQLTALKKVYADMGQALTMLQGEYVKRNLRVHDTYLYQGTFDMYDSTLLKTPEATAGRFLKENFKYTKDCGTSTSNCFASTYRSIEGNNTQDLNIGNSYSLMLSNGASIAMVPAYSSKVYMVPVPGEPAPPSVSKYPTAVYVDVNGPDKPNIGGRDMFTFAIDDEFNIVPTEGDCTKSSIGDGCLNEIIEHNWKMNY